MTPTELKDCIGRQVVFRDGRAGCQRARVSVLVKVAAVRSTLLHHTGHRIVAHDDILFSGDPSECVLFATRANEIFDAEYQAHAAARDTAARAIEQLIKVEK